MEMLTNEKFSGPFSSGLASQLIIVLVAIGFVDRRYK
jgi:hypothetical protein